MADRHSRRPKSYAITIVSATGQARIRSSHAGQPTVLAHGPAVACTASWACPAGDPATSPTSSSGPLLKGSRTMATRQALVSSPYGSGRGWRRAATSAGAPSADRISPPHRAGGQQGQDEVLHANVVVVQRTRLAQRQRQGLFRARRERDMAAGKSPAEAGRCRNGPAGGGVAAGGMAAPVARQPGQRALPPGWPPALAGCAAGSAQECPVAGVRAERRFDPGADDVQVDADGRQRLCVQAARRAARPLAPPGGAQDFRLDAAGRDALVAQHRAAGSPVAAAASSRCSQPM